LAHLAGEAGRLQRGIDLEGYRLVGKVQEMLMGADAGVGVPGGVVIAPGSFRIEIIRHGRVVVSHRVTTTGYLFNSDRPC